MEIFWRLLLGHFIADFTLQTNFIAAWKRRSKWGLFIHCAIHPILYSILLWNYLGATWVKIGSFEISGCTAIFLVFITHVIEDEWRIWSVLKKGAPDNTFFYFWDQFIHYAVIYTFSPVADGYLGKFGLLYYPPIPGILSQAQGVDLSLMGHFFTIVRCETWVLGALLFALVTHFTTVTIYFFEKDIYGSQFPTTKDKYIGMLERSLLFVCMLIPGSFGFIVAAVWIGRTFFYKLKKLCDDSWLHITIANTIAISCGLLARHLIQTTPF